MVKFADRLKKACFLILSVVNTILPIMKYSDPDNINVPDGVIIGASVASSVALGLAVHADSLEQKINDLLNSNKELKEEVRTMGQLTGRSQQVDPELPVVSPESAAISVPDQVTPHEPITPSECDEEVYNAYYNKRTNKYTLTPRVPK